MYFKRPVPLCSLDIALQIQCMVKEKSLNIKLAIHSSQLLQIDLTRSTSIVTIHRYSTYNNYIHKFNTKIQNPYPLMLIWLNEVDPYKKLPLTYKYYHVCSDDSAARWLVVSQTRHVFVGKENCTDHFM